jgi:hypothetical protein
MTRLFLALAVLLASFATPLALDRFGGLSTSNFKIMNRAYQIIFFAMFFCALAASAQLAVTVAPPKITGSKAIVTLTLKNNFTNQVESARAICFLSDDQGKMVGQSAKWVIGQNKTGLESGATNTFNFVITSPQPFTTTNLTAKISFSRIVLHGGKLADVRQTVTVTPQ